MILGYHFILSAYGFWLPNDPRGSWSEVVQQFDLLKFGPATKVNTTRSVAHHQHDVNQRIAAKKALRYPPVEFTGEQARAIARGFATAARDRQYIIHALAILPDHAHIVIARHSLHIDRIAAHLKSAATRQLRAVNLHPLIEYAASNGRVPSPWARKYWCPFIDSVEYMHAAIEYVLRNPQRSGLPAQRWKMIVPYRG